MINESEITVVVSDEYAVAVIHIGYLNRKT